MKNIMYLAALLVVSSPVVGQVAHHPSHADQGHRDDPKRVDDAAAVKDVLARYKNAIERLDGAGTEALFAADSAVFETGGSEGNYTQYLGHHLGPELKEFKSFSFSDYSVAVRLEGPVALASETYNYRIETKSGEIAERRGVATSVLKKIDGQWKILSMHNSARKPKGS